MEKLTEMMKAIGVTTSDLGQILDCAERTLEEFDKLDQAERKNRFAKLLAGDSAARTMFEEIKNADRDTVIASIGNPIVDCIISNIATYVMIGASQGWITEDTEKD